MYRKLLLSGQGGIIDEIHRSNQDNCAVVAIGLGGTGVSCLRNLKAKVFNRVVPDDPDSAVPKYDHIKFLAVDSDNTGLVGNEEASIMIDQLNIDTEYLDISYQGDIMQMFENNRKQLNNDSIYKEWLNHDKIEVIAARTGACGVRQIGRYLFMQKAEKFVSRVRELITDAKRGLYNPKVYVHVFTGIGGGTGAGTFLDAFYLVQKAIESEGTNAFVCGYAFLPDVNLSRIADAQTKAYIQVNGYASLQELDYCMNFQSNGDKWSQRYPGIGLVETNKPPMDICHIVSGRDDSGNIISNAYEYAMNVVTDYFMDFLVKTNGFTMDSHIANYVAKKSMLDKNSGALYEYCVLGASNAALPFKEVLTYLASRMFDKFSYLRKNQAGKADIDEFVKVSGLSFNSLFNMLVAQADMSFPRPDNSPKDAQENDDLTTGYFADLRSVVMNVVEKNFTTMTRDIESYDINLESNGNQKNKANASSIITKIFVALYGCMTDPAKGPYYAADILNSSTGHSLVAVINGHIAEIDSKIGQLEYNLPRYEQQRKADQDKFFGKSPNKGRYRAYVESSRELIIQYTKREVFYKMKSFLNKLREQLVDLSTKYCSIYITVINDLIDTFNANKTYLEDISDNVQCYEYPIATINELKESLDKKIDEIDINNTMIDFQKYMLSAEGRKAWITKNENEISKIVSKYFISLFNEYTGKTMTNYLQDKYDTDNTDELILRIRNDIMTELDKKASPLFWASVNYNTGNASKIGYISVPETSEEVCQAAESLHIAQPELSVRRTNLMDRITVMRCFVGAPIFGYHPISQYEVMSMNNTQAGKHLYEGREYNDENGNVVTGRDWRELPSLVPLSKMNGDNSKVLVDNAEHAKAVYDEAEELGFITENGGGDYVLKSFDEEFKKEIFEIAEKAKSKKDNVAMFEASEKIRVMLDDIKYSKKYSLIKNDAKNGQGEMPESEKRAVRIDHFASAPLIVKLAEEQIADYRKIQKLVEELIPKIDNDFKDFTEALFTGAIAVQGNRINYVDDFGDAIPLSAPNMPMGGIRPYQAFISYKELDEDIRKKLSEIAKERNAMAEIASETMEACANVKAMLDPKVKTMMLQIAKKNFTPESNTILQFFRDLEESLNEYMMTYGIIL